MFIETYSISIIILVIHMFQQECRKKRESSLNILYMKSWNSFFNNIAANCKQQGYNSSDKVHVLLNLIVTFNDF